ncbi:MAG: DUF4184 family protein [Chitinophagaceae bacterium]
MPFTFSHPAIILPLIKHKKWFSETALFIGAIIPDFDYFIKLKASTNFAHTIKGVFLFDLPISFIVLFIWNRFIKQELIKHLPFQFKEQYLKISYNKAQPKLYFIYTVSLFIGICSHLIWDAFTHYDGYTVLHFHKLSNSISFLNYSIKIYSLLQVLSSIIGLIVIVNYLKNRYVASLKLNITNLKLKFWVYVFLLQITILCCRFLIITNSNSNEDIIMAFLGALIYGFVFICFLYHKKIIRE